MYNCREHVIKDLESQRYLKNQYEQKLNDLPDGNLALSTVKGIDYYYKVINGKKIYLGTADKEEVRQLQTKKFLQKSLKRIDANCKVMERFVAKYHSIDPDTVNAALPKTYHLFPEADYAFTNWMDLQTWGSEPYDKSTKFPEGLKHRTVKGERVRSKSEVIIADILFLKGIEYHYEENLRIGTETIAPDFKVAVASQQRFRRIEHFGMIGDSKYLEECLWKIRLYVSNGYVPVDDVIFTFDTQDGEIDAQLIGQAIERLCR